jgi:hypothetical protein
VPRKRARSRPVPSLDGEAVERHRHQAGEGLDICIVCELARLVTSHDACPHRAMGGVPARRERLIDVAGLDPNQCPLVNRDVLSNAQYTAEMIWTDWSVELMQVLISSLWPAAFGLLSGLIGAFLVFQTKTPSAGSRSARAGIAP